MVIEHEAGDLTCTVEAATPLHELQGQLAGSGQMLALDPPGGAALTVGEVFDRALFGPRAHRYGRPRDLVLGIRARLPGGELIRGGGKVVKNVAGYDLPKLFTGAQGRLGELLELTVRLHPLPARHLHAGDRPRATSPPSSRWRRPASSTVAGRSGCWCASRARSPLSWPSCAAARRRRAGGRRRASCGRSIASGGRPAPARAARRPRLRRAGPSGCAARAPAGGRPLGARLAVRRCGVAAAAAEPLEQRVIGRFAA